MTTATTASSTVINTDDGDRFHWHHTSAQLLAAVIMIHIFIGKIGGGRNSQIFIGKIGNSHKGYRGQMFLIMMLLLMMTGRGAVGASLTIVFVVRFSSCCILCGAHYCC